MVLQPLLFCYPLPFLVSLHLPPLTNVPKLVCQVLSTVICITSIKCQHSCKIVTKAHIYSLMELDLHHVFMAKAVLQTIVLVLPLSNKLLFVVWTAQVGRKLLPIAQSIELRY